MGIGDWGLGIGIGDWGLGPIPNPQYPNPNPQQTSFFPIYNKLNFYKLYYYKIIIIFFN